MTTIDTRTVPTDDVMWCPRCEDEVETYDRSVPLGGDDFIVAACVACEWYDEHDIEGHGLEGWSY